MKKEIVVPFASFDTMHYELHSEMVAKFSNIYQKNCFIQGEELEQFAK